MIRSTVVIMSLVFSSALAWGQSVNAPKSGDRQQANQDKPSGNAGTAATSAGSQQKPVLAAPAAVIQSAKQKKQPSTEPRQTKRMLWIAPNFGAVTAGKELPPMTARQKFKLAFNDSFDYTSFVWTGVLAAQSMSLRQYPEFGGGMAAYGRYYWRGFLDGTSGTYFTEAIVPALTHEDPRYFTLGHGGFLRRLGYALSRTALTRRDSGGTTFNWSEFGGNGAEAALSNLYYPPEERGVTKTMENWGAQMESAALNNIAKEFWPDFRRDVLRRK